MFHQSDDKLKKESSRDEDDNEDQGSTPKAEEYDPMEAEDADDDDDDDGKAPSPSTNTASPSCLAASPGQWWEIMHHAEAVMDNDEPQFLRPPVIVDRFGNMRLNVMNFNLSPPLFCL